jgi:hypothetical protein
MIKRLIRGASPLIILVMVLLLPLSSFENFGTIRHASGENILKTTGTIVGLNPDDGFGWNVSGVGDVNGDGYDDILVGAPFVDGPLGNWWDMNWTYRRSLTFNNSAQAEALGNFPVLVTLNQTNFDYSKAKSDGSDLRFIDSDDTTILNYHIEDWNPNGNSYVWVNVNNIAASSSSDFMYLYYGNPKASDIRNIEGTYDGNFAGVWHLNETGTGTRYDSTSYDNDGTPSSYDGDEAITGKINGADDLDGSDDYIEIDSVTTDLDTTFTVSFWMKADSTSNACLVGFHGSGGGNIWRIEMVSDVAEIEGDAGSTTVSDGTWHYIVGVAEGSKSILYVDGELERDNIPETPNLIDSYLASIGQEYDSGPTPGDHFDGIIDEVRISNISRSSDWISAQYLSMTSGFINYGVEESNNQDRGAAYLFFGYSGINTNNIDASLANVTIHGSSAYDHFGWSLSGAGDLNADGFDDIIIGAPGYDVNQGRAYIFHGKTTPAWSSVLDADSDADTILTGENNQDRFGHSVSGVGDVDKDNYFDSWQFRKKITIQASEVTADLTDFPVVIQTIDLDLARVARIDGLDIVFTESDGKTLLDYEFESYNGTTGELIAWIRIPYLSSTVNTEIYMYYGNPTSQDHSNPEGVWSNGYVGIWHLNETSGDAQDSTSYGTSGLVSGSVTQGDTGQIDGAYNFDPSSSPNVDMGDPSDGHLDFGTGSFTFSTWANISASTGTWQNMIDKRGGASNPGYLLYTATDASYFSFTVQDGNDITNGAQLGVTFDTWTYLVGVVDRSDNRLHSYKDGSEVGTGIDITLIDSVNTAEVFLLSRTALDGLLDEVRVSKGVRTASWISTEFNNQNDTSSFYLIDPEEILPSNWFYRKQISIDSAKVAGDVIDFPVLINIIDPDLAVRARPDGFDIVFTQADGKTKLDHEIIKFENSTGTLSVWVKVPFISSLTNTNIYMYYGNSDSPNLENAAGVWSNGYVGVWHLDETAGNTLDSTPYGLDTTFPATASRGIDGQIGYAYRFYGSTGELDFGDPADGHLDFGLNSFSFSLWVNSTLLTQYQNIIWKGARFGGGPGYCFYRRSIANGGTVSISMGDSVGRVQNDFSIPEQTWIYIVGVADRTTDLLHGYLNGVEQGSGTDSSSVGSVDSADVFEIADNSDSFNGTVDEVRVSRTVRSADWVMTEYNNQVDPSSFYALGSEEIVAQNWYCYKPITIHSSQVIADLSDFPVLVEITDSDLMEKARNDGSDIVFTEADGKTKLDHEIESYDRKTGDLVAWVRVPFLSASSDTLIYMYYSNPEIPNQENIEGVWKYGYVGVYHMDENIGSITNSASQTNNGTRVNFPTQAKGHIGYGQKFAGLGADDLFNIGNLGLADGVNENLTMSFWANVNYTLTEDWGKIISKRNDADSDYVYHIGFNSAANKILGMHMNSDSSWSIPVDNDVWIYIVATFDGTFKKIYLNTTEILSDPDSSGPITSSNADVSIGSRLTTQNIGGLLDEIRFSKAVRSPVWIATEYNNQKDMASFITVGSELGGGKNDDVIVGAPGYSNETGRAYLFVGGNSFSGEILASDAKSIFNGNSQGDNFGHVVSGNGNINTLGFDDVVISAPGVNGNDGVVYAYHGVNPMPLILNTANSDVEIAGSSGFELGFSLSNVDDLNDDGFDDIIVGSPKNSGDTGAVYVFFGNETMNPYLTIMDADVTMFGEAVGDKFGYSISKAKDMNGDGINDMVVGAPYHDDGAKFNSGSIYIFEGGILMDGTSDWTIKGENDDDHFGWTVSHAGDITQDNLNYLIVGAPHNDDGGFNSGKAYLITATYKPVITNIIASPPTQIMGGNVNISCSVTAPSGIDSVWVNITLPGGGYINQSMIFDAGDTWFFDGVYIQEGVYQFVIWANSTFSAWSQSSIFQFSIINQPPSLSLEQVSPASGFVDSSFNFSVVYTDPDNQNPDTITVNITGYGIYDLIEQDPLDIDYTDGKQYYLEILSFSPGQYTFHFAANDSVGYWVETGIFGFDVINQVPILTAPLVNPILGYLASDFNFTVIYTDLDNQAPGRITVNISGLGVYDLLESDSLDVDYTDGKEYYLNTSGFSLGSYTFHFAANDSVGYWVETGIFGFDVINQVPTLASPLVNPLIGYLGSSFNFTVIYTDLDNQAPLSIAVNITGLGAFSLIESDPLDLDFTDGKSYYYDTSGFAIGQYQFNFAANDSLGDWIESSLLQFDVGNRRPTLSFDLVYPQTGYHEDHFNFTVTYSDSDNHAPNIITVNITNYGISALLEVDPLDTNYVDGKEYYFNSTLPSGSYSFHFAAEDILGNWALETMEIPDPVVSTRPGILDIEDYTREYGDALFLNASLVDNLGNPISGEDVSFYIDLNLNGIFEPQELEGIGTSSGIGEISYYYPSMISRGVYNYTAIYSGSGNYTVAADEAYITINPKPATLTASTAFVDTGKTAFLNATLIDNNGNPVINEQVALYLDKNRNTFYEASEAIVTVSTTVNGLATINYYISLSPENYGFRAKYEGSENYLVTEVLGLITVQSIGNTPPTISGTVPDQIKVEDSLPWTLNLNPYEDDIEDFGLDLTWYLEGVDSSLYSVTGENSTDDILTFIPKPNTFGNDEVILWLVDSGGKRDSQILWINITPVNDPPYFDPEPPDLFVHFDDPLNPDDDPSPWDFTFYVHDIETPTYRRFGGGIRRSGWTFRYIPLSRAPEWRGNYGVSYIV